MSSVQRIWVRCAVLVTAAMGIVSLTVHNRQLTAAFSDLICLGALLAAFALMIANERSSHGRERAFWSLYALGCAMWIVNQAAWTYFEVVVRKPLPDPFTGDVILFLHVVPFMAALAMRPDRRASSEELDLSTVNFVMLLIWWIFVYGFVVVPDEFVRLNAAVYSANYDRLYVVENVLFLLALAITMTRVSGAWKRVYKHLLIAGALYTASSLVINTGLRLKQYYSGSLYDLPFIVSIFWLVWAGLLRTESEPENEPQRSRWVAWWQRLAMIAILSLPAMAFWTVFRDNDSLAIRQFRLMLSLSTMLLLGACVFARQFAMDRELMRLLKRSHDSLESLERLQTQLVQKEKLASLGQVVAGAARDINMPIAAIIESCDSLATSEKLSAEQISTARKIGQQARRTQYLVTDLLSFAQQAPSQKSRIELTALLQRAIQMDVLRLQSKNIRVKTCIEADVPAIVGNANQLFQCCVQIIGNAEDELDEIGGGELIVSARREGDEAVIQFADSGRGLRQPDRVFDPFYTTKPIGKGTGLGLSATYGVVQDHGGQITCYNRAEGGAMFVIRLPIAAETATAANA